MGSNTSKSVDPYQKIAPIIQQQQNQYEEIRKKEEEAYKLTKIYEENEKRRQCIEAATKITEAINNENLIFFREVKEVVFDNSKKQKGPSMIPFNRREIPMTLIDAFNTVMKCQNPFDHKEIPSLSPHLEVNVDASFYTVGGDYGRLTITFDPNKKH